MTDPLKTKEATEQLNIVLAKMGYTGMRKKLFIKRFWQDPERGTDEMFITIKNANKTTKFLTSQRWSNNFEYFYEKNEKRWGDTCYDIDEQNKKYPKGHAEHIV